MRVTNAMLAALRDLAGADRDAWLAHFLQTQPPADHEALRDFWKMASPEVEADPLPPQTKATGRDFQPYNARANGPWPPLARKTRVRTTTSCRTPEREFGHWTPTAIVRRRWGVEGTVVGYHDSHGLSYEVRYDADKTIACFEPAEIEVIKPKE